MKKCLQPATLRNTSCGMSSINRHSMPGLKNALILTEGGQPWAIRPSAETKAEAVAPMVQQSASRSQPPVHPEVNMGGSGHRARLASEHQFPEKRTCTFLLLPLPSLAHQAAACTRASKRELHVRGTSRHAHIHQGKRRTQSP